MNSSGRSMLSWPSAAAPGEESQRENMARINPLSHSRIDVYHHVHNRVSIYLWRSSLKIIMRILVRHNTCMLYGGMRGGGHKSKEAHRLIILRI